LISAEEMARLLREQREMIRDLQLPRDIEERLMRDYERVFGPPAEPSPAPEPERG
jgi:hypothetical protein